jgi:hypothetical protein
VGRGGGFRWVFSVAVDQVCDQMIRETEESTHSPGHDTVHRTAHQREVKGTAFNCPFWSESEHNTASWSALSSCWYKECRQRMQVSRVSRSIKTSYSLFTCIAPLPGDPPQKDTGASTHPAISERLDEISDLCNTIAAIICTTCVEIGVYL